MALRVLPFLNTADRKWFAEYDRLALLTFRASAIAWLSVVGGSRHVAAYVANAAANAADEAYAAIGADGEYAFSCAVNAASSAADAAHYSGKYLVYSVAAVRYATSDILTSVIYNDEYEENRDDASWDGTVTEADDHVSMAIAGGAAESFSAATWGMLNEDIKFIGRGQSAERLAQMPLEAPAGPFLTSDGELFEPPETTVKYWREIKSLLLELYNDWDVWTDWYEDRLAGSVQNSAFEKALLTLTDDEWEQEPAVVNARLKELMEVDRSTFLMRTAGGASPSDFEQIPAEVIPAADRLVSVRHNQEPFDVLEKSLSEIRDEFGRDHNKQEYLKLQRPELLNAIETALSQIKSGLVSVNNLRSRLRPELLKLAAELTALGVVAHQFQYLVQKAIEATEFILKPFL